MLKLIHIIIIAAISIICYLLFYKPTIITNTTENFSTGNIDFHKDNDYNVVSYNYNLNENQENVENHEAYDDNQ